MSLVDLTLRTPARKRWLLRRRWQPGLLLAWLVMVVTIAWAIAPGWFTDWSGTEGVAGAQRLAPQPGHWLGTDQLGRDLFARIIWGASHSLSGALVAVVLGLTVGTLLGVVAGAVGGKTETVLMRLVDVLLSIPGLLLSLSVIILLGFGTVNAAIAVGITSIANFTRLARAEVMRVRHADFVEAAYGSGGTFFRVLIRHILPNSLTPVVAFSALQFGNAILAISTLSFLGYGTPPPTPEWGLLIAEGRNYLATAWWLTTFPGLVVVLVVLSANRISRQFSGERR
ncbi:ABC transporter permease [Pantoea sp. MBD-2R]|uniref:ABC transporter permease n=1 Tax=unclassified Pantoea TaxID=2630326 RepID=UPI0011BE60C3|nr:ABC transporter permease [Pantoea sp. CCBC3-3-1]